MKSRWKTYLFYGSLILVGGGLIYILVETVRAKNTGFETKTLWDWMELLIIPLFLAGGVFYLNRSEKEIERKTAEERAKLEREIAQDGQQEATLQAYLDRMTELLLNENLRTTQKEEVRNVARIRTLTILRGLDVKRRGLVLLFLQEAKLIHRGDTVVDLSGATMEDADLIFADLIDTQLLGVNLQGACLQGAYLQGACLQGANLHNANLLGADLRDSILQDTYLQGANISNEQLATVKSLKGATMPDGTKHE